MTQATVHGYRVAFWVAAGILAPGAVVIRVVMHGLQVAAEPATAASMAA